MAPPIVEAIDDELFARPLTGRRLWTLFALLGALGIWFWEPLAPVDWGWMAALCLAAALSHYLLIRAYELAEASALQPFAYTQLVWVSIIGMLVFGEQIEPHVLIGVAVIVGAGLFTLWRTRIRHG